MIQSEVEKSLLAQTQVFQDRSLHYVLSFAFHSSVDFYSFTVVLLASCFAAYHLLSATLHIGVLGYFPYSRDKSVPFHQPPRQSA